MGNAPWEKEHYVLSLSCSSVLFSLAWKEYIMGKNLKGKECGKGIYQRKDGLYHARFVDKSGKRHEKYFQTVPEAKNWIEEARFADQHEDIFVPTETTVDEWFGF